MFNYLITTIKYHKRFLLSIINWFRYWICFSIMGVYVALYYTQGFTFKTYFFGILCIGFFCSYMGEFIYLTFKSLRKKLKGRKVDKNV